MRIFGKFSEQRMREWCERYQFDTRVIQWLTNNPPPVEWQGTSIEYAYLEMPSSVVLD